MKGNLCWFFLAILLYYCAEICASNTRLSSLLLSYTSSSSSDSCFFFSVEFAALKELMRMYRSFPTILNIVVTDKLIENPEKLKEIINLQNNYYCKVTISISMKNARKLNEAKTIENCNILLSAICQSFKKLIFPQDFVPEPVLINCLNSRNFETIKIKKRFKEFIFSKWEAGIEALKFKGNYFFESSILLENRLKKMKQIMQSKNTSKQNTKFDAETLLSPTASKFISTSLRPGDWVLIFSDIKYKEMVQFFFKEKAAFLVNLDELQNINAPLILKLENDDITNLTTCEDILAAVNEIKNYFALNAFQNLEYVSLPREGHELVIEAFLACGVYVLNFDFIIEIVGDWVKSKYRGFGIVDLSYNAGEIVRAIDKHFDKNPTFNFVSFADSTGPYGFNPLQSVIKRGISVTGLGSRRVLRLNMDRSQVYERSFRSSQLTDGRNFINRAFKINFDGENGIDGGGLTREWFTELFKVIFDPNVGLFRQSEINQNVYFPSELGFLNADFLENFELPSRTVVRNTMSCPLSIMLRFADFFSNRILRRPVNLYPNELSSHNSNLLEHFEFAGKMIGISMSYPFPIGFQFADSFLKIILDKPLKLHDLKEVDEGLHTFLCWLLDNDVNELVDEYFFIYGFDYFGEHLSVELKIDGAKTLLTNENKFEYIDLFLRYLLESRIQPQITAFLSGFRLSVSQEQLAGLSVNYLGLLISGTKEINLNDWEKNTIYSNNFNAQSVQAVWFWAFLRTLDQSMLRKLLQFSTGSSSVPAAGFKALRGRNGVVKLFEIGLSSSPHDQLPTSRTCFNLIVMPEYISYDELVAKFTIAVTEGADNFAFC